MNLRNLLGRLDRAQKARWFKVTASSAMVLLIAVAFTWYAIGVENGEFGGSAAVIEQLEQNTELGADDPRLAFVRGILAESSVTASAAVGAALLAAISVIVIWLGLGLTYLALGLVAGLVAGPMLLAEPTELYGRLILAVLVLSAAFTALMQGARVALSGSGPVFGVARNMLTEAVRMKISLVLIILLMLGLAILPSFLNADQPLRFRVQSFFQYSSTGVFWILAFLTLAFGIASITAEQREKVIWQTMTKPVAAWQYLLGKWLGIVTLNAMLLLVSAAGIFLFAEYLRNQPAVGETSAYVSADTAVSEDRFILESRVMAARRAVGMDIPEELSADGPEFLERVGRYIESERLTDPNFATTPAELNAVVDSLYKDLLRTYRSIAPGGARLYSISGLEEAKRRGTPLTLRTRIDAGGNRPDAFYDMTFRLPRSPDPTPLIKKMSPGFFHNISLTSDSIDDNGVLEIEIINGRPVMTESGLAIYPNPSAATLPENGLEVSYKAGSYRVNFARVMLVLWVKLAFLAMVGVFASTFLSFPVACLIGFGVFVLAEMSGFLLNAAETYATTDRQGGQVWYKVVTLNITNWAGLLFKVYSDLTPVRRLVQGQLMPWSSVGGGTGVLLTLTGVLYLGAVTVFKRRELAIYSGN